MPPRLPTMCAGSQLNLPRWLRARLAPRLRAYPLAGLLREAPWGVAWRSGACCLRFDFLAGGEWRRQGVLSADSHRAGSDYPEWGAANRRQRAIWLVRPNQNRRQVSWGRATACCLRFVSAAERRIERCLRLGCAHSRVFRDSSWKTADKASCLRGFGASQNQNRKQRSGLRWRLKR